MHGAAVVPHHDVAFIPLLNEHMLRVRRVIPEFGEERIALVERHPDDPGAVDCSAEVERQATRLAVCAYEWMDDPAPFAKIPA